MDVLIRRQRAELFIEAPDAQVAARRVQAGAAVEGQEEELRPGLAFPQPAIDAQLVRRHIHEIVHEDDVDLILLQVVEEGLARALLRLMVMKADVLGVLVAQKALRFPRVGLILRVVFQHALDPFQRDVLVGAVDESLQEVIAAVMRDVMGLLITEIGVEVGRCQVRHAGTKGHDLHRFSPEATKPPRQRRMSKNKARNNNSVMQVTIQ
ncbi:hypothetical protein [Rhodovarius lipocyclicus]|uniref:hypothetical protein n=1 Tax=Rhodovarius lipocyclicus TaxID=268410 RepID=UPI001359DBF3|nr:hypothetical protein [Rhodovarius lipocyclicus]